MEGRRKGEKGRREIGRKDLEITLVLKVFTRETPK